ncbi:hypothetical protein J2W17_000877 [Pseudomonas lini]|nr:hypothetical protein [Pseudomonas lini]
MSGPHQDLLEEVLRAHGGLERWKGFRRFTGVA